ncbi:MAG TPA: efflux RND transporter permease subunit, partial [Flavitalea sp.]|nr:efflux RND transporter permease subunit [Flavitalea sp.]
STTVLLQKAIRYLFPAMLGSSLSTIVIFIPFELMSGVAGAYFKVLTNTMIITLVCSFFVTWICLPVIYLLLTRSKIKSGKKKNAVAGLVKNQKWISFFLFRPYISILYVAGLAASIYFIIPVLQTGFLPEMDEGSIVLDYSTPPGTSLDETDRILKEAEKIIVTIPEVSAYSRRTGTQMGFFITEPNTGDYLIQLKKDRKKTTDEVINEIRTKIESTQPALRIDFGQVIGDMLGDLMTSVQPIEIKVFGDNPNKLRELSRQIATITTEVQGTADVFDGIVIAGPSLTIQPDNSRLALYGLTAADLQFQLQTAIQGSVAGGILEKEQLSVIKIIYPGGPKLIADNIRNMQVFLPSGKLHSVGDLARIRVDAGDGEVYRENLQSMGVVTARLENRDLGGVIKDIQQSVSTKIVLPQGYHVEYGGAYAEQQQSFKELLLILITSSLLVFGVILFLFREFKPALIIVFISVLGTAGSLIALYLTQTPLNVGSYTGLIMIVGIIGENSIFTYLQFRESLKENSIDDSLVYSISTRLRPKLMTALGAIIALAPLALGIGTGAQLHQPLAIAVIGGFIVALPLLLIVLPVLLKFANRYSISAPVNK